MADGRNPTGRRSSTSPQEAGAQAKCGLDFQPGPLCIGKLVRLSQPAAALLCRRGAPRKETESGLLGRASPGDGFGLSLDAARGAPLRAAPRCLNKEEGPGGVGVRGPPVSRKPGHRGMYPTNTLFLRNYIIASLTVKKNNCAKKTQKLN